jgi:hypothetical protein
MADQLNFDTWKHLLGDDCARKGKLGAFYSLEELVLRLLYECGLAPTVADITRNPASAQRKAVMPALFPCPYCGKHTPHTRNTLWGKLLAGRLTCAHCGEEFAA